MEKTSQKYTIEDVLTKLFITIAGLFLLLSIWESTPLSTTSSTYG